MLQCCFWRFLWFWQNNEYFKSCCLVRWFSWKSKITCGNLSQSSRNHYQPSYYLPAVIYMCVCILLPLPNTAEKHLIYSLTSGCCSHVGKVGVDMGWAWWPCFLLSHSVLFLNLLLWTIVSPFVPSLPKGTCLENLRPRRNHVCYCPQCSPWEIPVCWLPFSF